MTEFDTVWIAEIFKKNEGTHEYFNGSDYAKCRLHAQQVGQGVYSNLEKAYTAAISFFRNFKNRPYEGKEDYDCLWDWLEHSRQEFAVVVYGMSINKEIFYITGDGERE